MTNIKNIQYDKIHVRLADTDEEIRAAQRLRYNVFYEEYAATPDQAMAKERRDFDSYDDYADHLIVFDSSQKKLDDQIVGTYRLLRQEMAQKKGQFYTSDEYDISPLVGSSSRLLELGRSCVKFSYRTRPILQLLWEGIAKYMHDYDIELMFGCASFHSTDIPLLSKSLSYLHHYHLADPARCPKAVPDRYVDMNLHDKDMLDIKAVFSELPPLIKGYIRLGASIGDGAVIDHQFNTTDVCIVLPMNELSERYKNHYSRKKEARDAKALPAKG